MCVCVSLFVYVCGKQFKNKYKKLAQNVAAMGRMNDREGNLCRGRVRGNANSAGPKGGGG